MPRFRRKNESKELPAKPAEPVKDSPTDEPEQNPYTAAANKNRQERWEREAAERRAAISARPTLLREEKLEDLQERIDQKRENLKHAGDPVTLRRARRSLEALEAEHDALWAQVYHPIEGCAFGDDGKHDPDGPLFEPIRCSNYECDGIIRDSAEALDQLGKCAVCYLNYINPKPKPRRKGF